MPDRRKKNPTAQGIDPALPLENKRHETFSQLIAGGMAPGQAYMESGYNPSSIENARIAAVQLKRRAEVRQRISYLQITESEQAAVLARTRSLVLGGEEHIDAEITTSWLLYELYVNLSLAREQGNIKDANQCLKMIADLKEFMPKNKGDANQPLTVAARLKNADNRPTINLSILNQIPDGMGESAGGRVISGDFSRIASPEDAGEDHEDDGDDEPASGGDDDEGEA